jgi:ParB-like chromosome segregation protein Spo0J
MSNLLPKPDNYIRSYVALQQEGRDGKTMLDRPTSLPLKSLKFASNVFQPRSFDGDTAESDAHIRTLMDAIRHAPDHQLDPIVVWWSGKAWYVLDGHHRTAAYKNLARDQKKPLVVPSVAVEVFSGSLADAIEETARLNSRNKLPMSKEDKTERAWRIVVLDDGSKSKQRIASSCGVSTTLVANMRTKLRELKEANGEDFDAPDPMSMTWKAARRYGTEEMASVNEEWMRQQAKQYAKRLSRQFRGQLVKTPTVTAMALRMYARQLPKLLADEFRSLGFIDQEDERDPDE